MVQNHAQKWTWMHEGGAKRKSGLSALQRDNHRFSGLLLSCLPVPQWAGDNPARRAAYLTEIR
jgi:hypothetical protein